MPNDNDNSPYYCFPQAWLGHADNHDELTPSERTTIINNYNYHCVDIIRQHYAQQHAQYVSKLFEGQSSYQLMPCLEELFAELKKALGVASIAQSLSLRAQPPSDLSGQLHVTAHMCSSQKPLKWTYAQLLQQSVLPKVNQFYEGWLKSNSESKKKAKKSQAQVQPTKREFCAKLAWLQMCRDALIDDYQKVDGCTRQDGFRFLNEQYELLMKQSQSPIPYSQWLVGHSDTVNALVESSKDIALLLQHGVVLYELFCRHSTSILDVCVWPASLEFNVEKHYYLHQLKHASFAPLQQAHHDFSQITQQLSTKAQEIVTSFRYSITNNSQDYCFEIARALYQQNLYEDLVKDRLYTQHRLVFCQHNPSSWAKQDIVQKLKSSVSKASDKQCLQMISHVDYTDQGWIFDYVSFEDNTRELPDHLLPHVPSVLPLHYAISELTQLTDNLLTFNLYGCLDSAYEAFKPIARLGNAIKLRLDHIRYLGKQEQYKHAQLDQNVLSKLQSNVATIKSIFQSGASRNACHIVNVMQKQLQLMKYLLEDLVTFRADSLSIATIPSITRRLQELDFSREQKVEFGLSVTISSNIDIIIPDSTEVLKPLLESQATNTTPVSNTQNDLVCYTNTQLSSGEQTAPNSQEQNNQYKPLFIDKLQDFASMEDQDPPHWQQISYIDQQGVHYWKKGGILIDEYHKDLSKLEKSPYCVFFTYLHCQSLPEDLNQLIRTLLVELGQKDVLTSFCLKDINESDVIRQLVLGPQQASGLSILYVDQLKQSIMPLVCQYYEQYLASSTCKRALFQHEKELLAQLAWFRVWKERLLTLISDRLDQTYQQVELNILKASREMVNQSEQNWRHRCRDLKKTLATMGLSYTTPTVANMLYPLYCCRLFCVKRGLTLLDAMVWPAELLINPACRYNLKWLKYGGQRLVQELDNYYTNWLSQALRGNNCAHDWLNQVAPIDENERPIDTSIAIPLRYFINHVAYLVDYLCQHKHVINYDVNQFHNAFMPVAIMHNQIWQYLGHFQDQQTPIPQQHLFFDRTCLEHMHWSLLSLMYELMKPTHQTLAIVVKQTYATEQHRSHNQMTNGQSNMCGDEEQAEQQYDTQTLKAAMLKQLRAMEHQVFWLKHLYISRLSYEVFYHKYVQPIFNETQQLMYGYFAPGTNLTTIDVVSDIDLYSDKCSSYEGDNHFKQDIEGGEVWVRSSDSQKSKQAYLDAVLSGDPQQQIKCEQPPLKYDKAKEAETILTSKQDSQYQAYINFSQKLWDDLFIDNYFAQPDYESDQSRTSQSSRSRQHTT